MKQEHSETLTVGQIMQRDVRTVSFGCTMAEVAEKLSQYRVSVAPVVDEFGRLVGLISARHFIGRHHPSSETASATGAPARLILDDAGQGLFIEVDGQELVDRHMNHAIQTIAAEAPLSEAARMMCTARIHHLVVVDESQRPAGIVSSLDLVAAAWELEIPQN